MNIMIFDVKQSFGPRSQAEGRLLSNREIWYLTPLVFFRGEKSEHKPQGMIMVMTFNVIWDTWVLLLMLISCRVAEAGNSGEMFPIAGKGII